MRESVSRVRVGGSMGLHGYKIGRILLSSPKGTYMYHLISTTSMGGYPGGGGGGGTHIYNMFRLQLLWVCAAVKTPLF